MSKLTRNQIIAILVFGVVLLGGALVILSNRQSTEPTDVVTTESVDATVVAQNATEEPSSQPSPTPQAQTRSDDSDGDGVPNDGTDQCPEVAGDAAFNGCPNPDTDGDGVDDSKEPAECVGAPDAGFGIGSTGCPNPDPNTVNDDDGDGFVNASDSCPTQGDAGFGVDGTGCPNPDPNTVNDDDGDGFVNASDSCPTQGDAGFGIDGTGCPLPDPNLSQPQNVTRACEIGISTVDNVTFTFEAINVQNVSVFTWDFGGGDVATGQSVSRTFNQPGTYNVLLTCADESGNQLGPISGSVEVTQGTGSTVACEITASTSGNSLPVTVTWSVTGVVGDLDTFSWDFGGGDVQTGQSVTKIYDTAGIYNVALTCSGAGGTVGPLTGTVDISSATSSSSSLEASFTSNLPSGAFPQTLNLTSNVTGTHPAYTYAWVITGPNGYNQTSSEANPSFQLPEAGTYNITLTVTDSFTPTANSVISRGSITAVLDQPAPVVTIQASTLSVTSGGSVIFNAVNTGGPISSYSWNFAGGTVISGDVSGAGPIEVSFTGGQGQTFNVTLDVLGPDGDGANALRQIVITGQGEAVKASFTYVNNGQVGTNFQLCFTSTSTGNVTATEWDFDNNGSFDSTDAAPCFEFTPGQHIVTLKVTGPGGVTSSSQQRIFIAEGVQPPVAAFTIAKTTVNVGEIVTPTNLSTGQIDTYEWTWGDNTSSSTQNPSHTYTAEGTYVVNLKVVGQGGSSEAAAVTVEVRYATVTCPISGKTAATYGNNTFSVSLKTSELGGRTATVRWLVDGAEVATGNSYTRSITTAGTTVINVEVLIDGTVVCNASASVTLTLTAATCTLSGSTTVLLNQSIQYELKSFNNLNGRTVNSYFWEFTPSGGTATTYTTTGSKQSFTFGTSGTYTVKVTATLSDGTTCIRETTVTVSESAFSCSFDRFPSSGIIYNNGEYRVKIDGNTSGKTFTYKWFIDGVEVTNNNRTLYYAFTTLGDHNVRVEVSYNGSVICDINRGIGIGAGSTDAFCSFQGNTSFFLNQSSTFTVLTDTNRLGVRTVTNIEWFINGTSVQSGSSTTYTTTLTPAATYTLRIVVTPSAGVACVIEKTITIKEAQLECYSISGSSAEQFDVKTYSIEIAPSGLAGVTYKWFVNDVEQASTSNQVNYFFEQSGNSTVKVQVFLNGTLMCEKTKTVTVEADGFECSINAPAEIFVDASATFTVNLSDSNGRTMNYQWFLNGSLVDSDNRFTYTFTQTTPQTVQLVVTPTRNGLPAGEACDVSYDFSARAQQSISVDADRYVVFQGQTVNFTATTDIAPPYKWFVNGSQVGTTQTTTYSYIFNQVGDFTVEVEGVGVIRTQRASVNIKVVDYSQINVTFIANPWEALAPREICFTPTTDIDEALITEWLWTFHDGSTSNLKTPCFTYTTPGEYNVTLRVTDGLLIAESTNKVRLYEVVDANATFNVTPKGGLEYCFAPSVSSGVTVTEFEFGDGSTGTVTNNGEVCHTYQSEGSYVVRMKFSKGQQQGVVPRTVVITSGGSESFSANLECRHQNGTVTFTVTFNGQAMSANSSYPVSYSVISPAPSGPTSVGTVSGLDSSNRTATFEVRGMSGNTVTFNVEGLGELTRTVECWDKSSVSVSGECKNGVITFYVENTGTEPMSAPTNWTLTNVSTGTVLETGTIQLLGSERRPVTFTNPDYAGLVLRLNVEQRPGHSGSSNPNFVIENCGLKPELTVSGVCEYGTGRALFTIGVPAGGANLTEVASWTGTGASTVTGTFGPANAGSSSNPIAVLTDAQGNANFSVEGYETATASVTGCYKLTLESICWDNPTSHTMRVNNANSVNVDYSWSVGNLSGQGTATSGQSNFNITGLNYGDYPTVSLFVAGQLVATKTINSELCTPPGVEGNYECVSNGVYRFTVDGILFGTATYYIFVDWNIVEQKEITQADLPLTVTYNSTSNNVAFDVYSPGHFKYLIEPEEGCYEAPVYTPAGYCEENGVYGFTITHTGGLPTGSAGVSFEVRDGVTVIDSGTLTHEEASSFNRTYNSTSSSLTLVVTNNETQQVKTHVQPNCYDAPEIELTGYCEETNGNTFFSASLTGTPVGTLTYTIVDQTGATVDSGDLSALFNGKTFTGSYTSLTLSVSGSGDIVTVYPKTVYSCYNEPQFEAYVYCDESETNGSFYVVINDNGYLPLPGDAFAITYEVLGAGNSILVDRTPYTFGGYSNTFTGQTSVTVNVFMGGMTLVASDTNDNCYYAPEYLAIAYCSEGSNGSYYFAASNIGGQPITSPATFSIVDQDNNEVLSGSVTELPVTLTGTYTTLTMTLSTEEGSISEQAEGISCYEAPKFQAAGVCADQNGGFTFTITNIGGSLIDGVTLPTYVITDSTGAEVASGNVTIPFAPLSVVSENEPLTISLSGGTGGIEDVEVTTTDDCFKEPEFEANVYCAEENGVFIVSITNKGGVIVETKPTYEIFIDGESQGVVEFDNAQLPFNETLPAGRYGNVSVTVTYGETVVSADNSECYRQPEYTPAGYCTEEGNGIFYFTLSQTGGGESVDGVEPTFEITGDGFTTITGNMSELAGNMPIIGTYENGLTMTVTTTEGIITVEAPITIDCYEPPVWTPTAVCGDANGLFLFSVELVSGSPINGEEPTFTIEVVGNPTPAVTSGVISQLPSSIIGRYSSVTLTIKTTEGYISAQAEPLTTCYEPPVYVPAVECTDTNGEFTVTVVNQGGEPVLSSITILVDFAVINGGGTGAEEILNAQLPFTKTYTGEFQYVQVSVSSEDIEPVTAINENCFEPPVYVPEIVCAEESNGTFNYGFINTGGEPIPGISYTPYYRVFDQNGDTLDEGYSSAPFSSSVTGPFSSVTITLYTNIEGMEVATTTNENCYVPPVYEPTGYCDEVENGTFYFEISNTGGTPVTSSYPTYSVVDENGNPVVSGTVATLPTNIGPLVGEYGKLTLIITVGTEGSVTAEATDLNCYKPPVYVPRLTCLGTNGVYAGQILNAGGEPMFTVATYQIVDNEGNVLADGIVGDMPFDVTSVTSISTKVTLSVFINGETLVSFDTNEGCFKTEDETPTPTPPVTEEPEEPVCGETIETEDGEILINLEMCDPDPELGVPEWSPIEIGGAICPDWLVYHTNKTGDWELFRLGELPDGLTGPENLSQGVGPDVYDLAPSRSPDGLWIAFASTRDTAEGSRVKNWEIYVARVTGDDTRRITYNEFAMDLDPVWAPNGLKLAYETTTDNGDWEVRVFDLLTGENTIVTNNPANDINPSWSPDGSKLLIQSDREGGLWQIYEIDLANGNAITKLSDGSGDDHDPMYSNDGTKVVFRSYRDDPRPDGDRSRVSAVYYMNSDGTGVTRVSEVGGNATNHVFSPDDKLIAYQSNIVNGINDIYVFEIETGLTRLLTNNTGDYANIQDTAPTWYCESTLLVFTSSVDATDENPDNTNVFAVDALPIDAPAINPDEEATRLTDDEEIDRDAQNSPSEENASRYGQVPPKWRP